MRQGAPQKRLNNVLLELRTRLLQACSVRKFLSASLNRVCDELSDLL